MSASARTLVLFDIDGTLLDTHGAGKSAFIRALEAVFGWKDDIRYIRFAGATDLDVLRQVARRHGRELQDREIDAFFDRLPAELEQTTRSATLTLYPGVRELLAALSCRDDAVVGLVTGNIEACARIKLDCFNLHGHFELGAFGHEHGDRREIARLAVRRADGHSRGGACIARRALIGDTPSDIEAAHAIAATAIAVATGVHPAVELRAAGADHVVDSLGDTGAILRLLGIGDA